MSLCVTEVEQRLREDLPEAHSWVARGQELDTDSEGLASVEFWYLKHCLVD